MEIIDVRRDLHQIPEVGFKEYKTQHYLLRYIQSVSTDHVDVTTWETGIIVKVNGTNQDAKSIGWRTDIDGLPITEQTNVAYESIHPGYMHACGHDFHMAIALGALTNVIKAKLEHTVIFYFQPAEEGPGGAEPLVTFLKNERNDLLADEIFALHIAPEYEVGVIATRPGLLFANTSELNIALHGVGGHAAFPHKTKDMSVAAAALLMQLQSIISRNIDPLDSGVITIGKMTSGTVQNIISDYALLEGTIRTLSVETMHLIKSRIETICKGIETIYECTVSIDYGSMYYEVSNTAESVQTIFDVAQKTANVTAIESPLAMTGEDFGYFLKEVPGAMFWAGVNSKYGLHHAKLEPDESVLQTMIPFVTNLLAKI